MQGTGEAVRKYVHAPEQYRPAPGAEAPVLCDVRLTADMHLVCVHDRDLCLTHTHRLDHHVDAFGQPRAEVLAGDGSHRDSQRHAIERKRSKHRTTLEQA